jgi:hypothetical protein
MVEYLISTQKTRVRFLVSIYYYLFKDNYKDIFMEKQPEWYKSFHKLDKRQKRLIENFKTNKKCELCGCNETCE